MDSAKTVELKRMASMLGYFAMHTYYCGITKANKLFFLADCLHLIRHGRTITRDSYVKLPQGPVPENLYYHLTSLMEMFYPQDDELSISVVSDYTEFISEYVEIRKTKMFDYEMRLIVAKKDFEYSLFSETERQILEEIASLYKRHTAKELSELTHKERAYIEAESSGPVDLFICAAERMTPAQFEEAKHIDQTIRAMELNY